MLGGSKAAPAAMAAPAALAPGDLQARAFTLLQGNSQAPPDFFSAGPLTTTSPGLEVAGVGAVALPLDAAAAAALAAVAAPCPFGRGEETVVDPAVRRCLQLEPAQSSLTDPGVKGAEGCVAPAARLPAARRRASRRSGRGLHGRVRGGHGAPWPWQQACMSWQQACMAPWQQARMPLHVSCSLVVPCLVPPAPAALCPTEWEAEVLPQAVEQAKKGLAKGPRRLTRRRRPTRVKEHAELAGHRDALARLWLDTLLQGLASGSGSK